MGVQIPPIPPKVLKKVYNEEEKDPEKESCSQGLAMHGMRISNDT